MTTPSGTPRTLIERIEAHLRAAAPHTKEREQCRLLAEALSALRKKPRAFPAKRKLLAELSQSRDDALEEAARVCDAQETESFMVLSTARAGAAAMKAACVKAIRSLKGKPAPILKGD